jgi:hypothetical protein
MALSKEANARHSLKFVLGSEECRVDLRSPRPVRRRNRRMVQLIDLWVATMLPWDVVDLTFDVIVTAPGGDSVLCGPIDGLHFAQGFVDLRTRELWWGDAREGTPHGLRVVAVVAHVRTEAAPVRAPRPAPARAPAPLGSLARLLPHAETAYPCVEWRLVPLV